MSQLELGLEIPAHCPSCDPARDEENLRILYACTREWLTKCLDSLSLGPPLSPDAGDLFHHKHRRELFETALARAA